MPAWRVAGSYLESCNCEAICPCRRIDGVMGGRSTYGICLGALSWQVLDGYADGVNLDGLGVVLACRYSDDEEGSPWSFVLYVDERGDDDQRAALEAIFTGRWPGSQVEHFPWAWKASRELAVRPAEIEIDHVPGRGWFRVGGFVEVRVARPIPSSETVTCVIPGHERTGREVIADSLVVSDGELEFSFRGNCGYESDFEYQG
ncbi:MAG TPA: DUF1326 domain-containing protein [Gaiellaceae bacterium]|nr:DUF1326 domain-containing protein [Gaiellaceae bacterium]